MLLTRKNLALTYLVYKKDCKTLRILSHIYTILFLYFHGQRPLTKEFLSRVRVQYIYQDSKNIAILQPWYIRFYPCWSGQKSSAPCTLIKRPINQFKPVQQSRQQVLRAYCPNIYTVSQSLPVCPSASLTLFPIQVTYLDTYLH